MVRTLSDDAAPAFDLSPDQARARFTDLLAPADPSSVWLALAVLHGELPTSSEVVSVVRAVRLDGVEVGFRATLEKVVLQWARTLGNTDRVIVHTGSPLVDLEHTARTGLATGIQRVARETTRRWVRDHDLELVAWSDDHRRLRLLTTCERSKALTGDAGARTADGDEQHTVVVPWQSTYLLPELSTERARNERIAALAQYARCRTGVIGFDCVPITTAETTAIGVSEAFATNLSAVRHMDRVSAISLAAASEYRGWGTMLTSTNGRVPEISAELLPDEAAPTTDETLAVVRRQLTIPGVPMVLCVGTHEPRKNHVALLHACEVLWRQGVRFNLVLVGGRSWNDERFQAALGAARLRNRPVETVRTLSDEGLWAAYRLARCTVFPSLNEGFGLPIAESLACGTPVVTSAYGSMAEVAQGGGALLIDPRDDASIADALKRLVTDDGLHAELVAAARDRPTRTWDAYAADVWTRLVG